MIDKQSHTACPDHELLHDLSSGHLDDNKIKSLVSHLDTCRNCEETFGRITESQPILTFLRNAPAEDFVDEQPCQDGLADAQGLLARELGVQLPQQFGNYRLLERIGHGGMSTVYAAEHLKLHKKVAIKALSPSLTKDPESLERFRREIEMSGSMDHPNIARAMDAGEIDGVHYLVMEFINGVDLAKVVVRNGPMSADDACSIIRQVAEALQYAHDQGLVHRDVKPSNVVLQPDGSPKLLDLGLARLIERDSASLGAPRNRFETEVGAIVGTVDYMSPEQALDTQSIDHRTDIYSLGCTLFFLLNGAPPYPEGNSLQRIIAHRESPIPSLDVGSREVPCDLDAVYRRMVAKSLEDRFQTMDEVAAALQPFSDSSKSISRPRRSGAKFATIVSGLCCIALAVWASGFLLHDSRLSSSSIPTETTDISGDAPAGKAVLYHEDYKIRYVAEAGSENHVTISETANGLILKDTGATIVVPNGPFTIVAPNEVRIRTNGITEFVVQLGDGNDSVDASAVNSLTELPLFEFNGGEGDDALVGSARRDVFIESAGNDKIDGRDSHDDKSGDQWRISCERNLVLTNNSLTINGEIDRFTNIEDVRLYGSNRRNTFDATAVTAESGIEHINYYDKGGDDRMLGSGIRDSFGKGAGHDFIDGFGGKTDLLIADFDVDMKVNDHELSIAGEVSSYQGIEQIILSGGEADNTIDASGLTLSSGITYLRLTGNAGDDVLIAGGMSTEFWDSTGSNQIIGGEGQNDKWAISGVSSVQLMDDVLVTGKARNHFRDIEQLNIDGDSQNNVMDLSELTTASGIAMLFVSTKDGDDRIVPSQYSNSAMSIDGGYGFDWLDVSRFSTPPKIAISGPGPFDGKKGTVAEGGRRLSLTFQNIDDFITPSSADGETNK